MSIKVHSLTSATWGVFAVFLSSLLFVASQDHTRTVSQKEEVGLVQQQNVIAQSNDEEVKRIDTEDLTAQVLTSREVIEPEPSAQETPVSLEYSTKEYVNSSTLFREGRCPFEEKEGRVIIDLTKGGTVAFSSLALRADGRKQDAYIGPVGTKIEPGAYSVYFASYRSLEDMVPNAFQEQWFLKMFAGTEEVATTKVSRDIRNDEDVVIELVEQSVSVKKTISKLMFEHAAYPSKTAESVSPVCVVFDRQAEQKERVSERKEEGVQGTFITKTTVVIPKEDSILFDRSFTSFWYVHRDKAGEDLLLDSDMDMIVNYDETYIYKTDPLNAHSLSNTYIDGEVVLSANSGFLEQKERRVFDTALDSAEDVSSHFFIKNIRSVPSPADGGAVKVEVQIKAQPFSFVTLYVSPLTFTQTIYTDGEGNATCVIPDVENGSYDLYMLGVDTHGSILAKAGAYPFVKRGNRVFYDVLATPLVSGIEIPLKDQIAYVCMLVLFISMLYVSFGLREKCAEDVYV